MKPCGAGPLGPGQPGLALAGSSSSWTRARPLTAGAVVQKFVNYRLRLVVVGDVSEHVAASTALRDFVREANRGTQTGFVADEAELAAWLRTQR